MISDYIVLLKLTVALSYILKLAMRENELVKKVTAFYLTIAFTLEVKRQF